MRSRAVRWTFVVVAWIALASAGFFLFSSQKQIAVSADALRAVDGHAREADDALTEARVAQQAYVASGQGVAFWVPKVASSTAAATTALKALRDAATFPAAKAEADEAAAAIGDFTEVDKRARDYINASQSLMAGDVIYTEGSQAIASASRHVELARQSERQAFDATEAQYRKQQAIAIGGAALLAGLIALVLVPAGASDETGSDSSTQALDVDARARRVGATLGIEPDEGIVSHARRATSTPAPTATPAATPPPSSIRSPLVLKAVASLATDFGRVTDSDELDRLLARTADLIDASGIVVWLGDTSGGDLQAVLSHGYTARALGRMPAVPRNADNAAAMAYRTSALQIVVRRPGGKQGAIVAPIMASDGCIGALSAEINDGGEGSEAVQAIATIVASHLAAILTAASIEQPAATAEQKAAAQ